MLGDSRDEEEDKMTLSDLAEAGMLKEMKELLEKGEKVDVNEKGEDDDYTALHWACVKGNLEMVDLLLNAQADVNTMDDKGCTPLHVACKFGRTDIIQRLIEKGARIHKIDRKGNTPLHVAAKFGKVEAVKILVGAGVNIKMKDTKGRTACERAMERDHNETVELLLKAGSDKIKELQQESEQVEKQISDVKADLNKMGY